MHRRARHLKPKSIGAHYAFDSRYISGLSDGTSITTWNDISGNARDATQATSTKKPTYKTGIQGGNPIARFDGGDGLVAPAATFNNVLTTFAIWSASVNGIVYERGASYNTVGGCTLYTHVAASSNFVKTSTEYSGKNRSSGWGIGSVWMSCAQTNAGTHSTHTMKINGVEQSLTTNASSNYDTNVSGNITLSIGSRNATSVFLTGDISFVMMSVSAISRCRSK
jgi:hypothetical protein